MKNVLLICPPTVTLHGPPFGLAAIAGHLRIKRPKSFIRIEDLNIRCAKHILATVPNSSELHKKIRSRWTQADILLDALSRWAFAEEAPSGLGAMPDWECRYLAELFSQILDNIADFIKEEPLLIGLSVCDNSFIAAVGLTRRLKLSLPSALLVWGGVSVSEEQAPAVLRAIPEIDAIVVGEGEEAFVSLFDAAPHVPGFDIPGVLTRNTKGRVRAQRQHYLPSEPAYDLFDLSIYPALELPVSVARGCNWGKCIFCNDAYRGSHYQPGDPLRSARWALDWQRRFRPVSFELVDSAATADRSSFRQFADALTEGGGLREWRCMMRTDQVFGEDLDRAVASGLKTVYFGLESLDDSVLKRMRKGCTVSDHLRAITLALERGLKVEGDLIIFHPGETAETIRQSARLIRSFEHLFSKVSISFSRFIPSLRSKTWICPEKYGIRLTEHSLYLARRLPEAIAKSLVYSDRVWEYTDQHREVIIGMANEYLEMQTVLSSLEKQQEIRRTWQQLGEIIVLETFGHQGQALDRIFLEGLQKKVWDLIPDVLPTKELVRKTNIPSEDLTEFLLTLQGMGFCYGSSDGWVRVATAVR